MKAITGWREATARLGDLFRSVPAEARLTMSWTRRELQGTYRQSSLRRLWSVIQPLSVLFVYVMVFHWILRVDAGDLPYLSFMVVGVVLWRYFVVSMAGATVLVEQAHVLSKVYFRREIVPISRCVAGLIDLGIGTLAAVAIATWQGLPPRITILALPLIYVPLILYTAAVAVVLATVTVFVRDVGLLMPTLVQTLFLATPIMYPPSQLPENLRILEALNPIASLIDAARSVLLRGSWPSFAAIALHSIVGSALFVVAIAYIRSIEHRIVDVA